MEIFQENEKLQTNFSSDLLFYYKIDEILLAKSDIVALLNDMWLSDNVNLIFRELF